ncbi:MAG: HDOD domain-containing protein [Phycisphaerales bacterium]|nr:HDOD domain-containing protein [Phycisphaerales bacterium]
MATAVAEIGKVLPKELQEAMARVTEINSLPEITTKIVEVVEDPRATAHDMHEIVRTDPALAAKILKVVNSAFYGLPSQIASLDRAILMLGLSAVKNIALAASLSRMFNVEMVSEQFAARDLWRHSVAVAVCARLLAVAGKAPQVDEAFVAGLVHDLGLVAVQQMFPQKMREATEICFNEPRNFRDVESALVGADHQAFGAALARKWKFPPVLQAAIGCHHDPHEAPPEFLRLAQTIHIADRLCGFGKFGFWIVAGTDPIAAAELAEIRVTPAQIEALQDELPDRVEEAESVFTD